MRYIVFLFLCINYHSVMAQCLTRISPDGSFTICKGNSIQINTNSSMTQYQWWPNKGISDTTVSSPIVSPDSTITYHIKAVDPTGCVDTASITVNIVDCSLPGQLITFDNNDFGSGKINPSVKSYNSLISVPFVPLSGDPPSAFTTDGYSEVNKIPQSINNDWHTGALNHTPNQGDSGYMAVFHNAPKDSLLYTGIFPNINYVGSFLQISFSYSYPYKKPLNLPCNGSSLPSFPSLMVKINAGIGTDKNNQPLFPDSAFVTYPWPTGTVLMPQYFIFYPDPPASDPNNLIWKTFTATSDHTRANYIHGGEPGYRLQIFNLTPPSPCGNDIVLDDIHYNFFLTYSSLTFRLPYDTIKTCSKNPINLTATDFSYTPSNDVFGWYRSIDQGKTWQFITNSPTNKTQFDYTPQQNEEWIRLDSWSNISPLPKLHFQSNHIVLLSNYVFNTTAGKDTAICKGASLQLNARGGTYNVWTPADYLSNTNTLNPVITPAMSMQYILQTSNDPNFAANCTVFDTINIQVDEKPIVVAGNNQTINQGDSTKMNGVVAGNDVLLHWEPKKFFADNTKPNAICKPDTTRIFYLYADSKYGCGTGLDSMKIIVTPTAVVIPIIPTPVASNTIIPNAFSPNGDGINDTWDIPLLKSYPNCSVEVYSRYGQLVFKSIGYSKNWDGTFNNQSLPIGAYYYIIKTSPSASSLSGSVLIIR